MNHALDSSECLVVRLPNWLGDFVMAEPAVAALIERARRERTLDRLALVGPARFLPLLDAADVPSIPTEGAEPSPADLRAFDVALLLTGSFRSAWTAWRAGVPVRVGQARDGRSWLLTHGVRPAYERGRVPLGRGRAGRWPRVLPRPFGHVAVELVQALGVLVVRRRPRVVAPALESPFGGAAFTLANVGSRVGSAKGWPAEHWAQALSELGRATGRPALVVCGPGEEAVAREVVRRLDRGVTAELCVPALGELAAAFRAAELALTADVGPRHLAQAVGTPTVVVVGPTDPRHTDDHPANVRVLRHRVPCGPCHREVCPLPEDALEPRRHACMRAVEPAEVVRAALALVP